MSSNVIPWPHNTFISETHLMLSNVILSPNNTSFSNLQKRSGLCESINACPYFRSRSTSRSGVFLCLYILYNEIIIWEATMHPWDILSFCRVFYSIRILSQTLSDLQPIVQGFPWGTFPSVTLIRNIFRSACNCIFHSPIFHVIYDMEVNS